MFLSNCTSFLLGNDSQLYEFNWTRMVSLVGDVVSLREEPRPKNYGRSVSFSCRNVGVAAGGKLMNVTEVLRKIFSQPQGNDESMVTPERLNFVLQQLSEYRNEIMSSPDYHA